MNSQFSSRGAGSKPALNHLLERIWLLAFLDLPHHAELALAFDLARLMERRALNE